MNRETYNQIVEREITFTGRALFLIFIIFLWYNSDNAIKNRERDARLRAENKILIAEREREQSRLRAIKRAQWEKESRQRATEDNNRALEEYYKSFEYKAKVVVDKIKNTYKKAKNKIIAVKKAVTKKINEMNEKIEKYSKYTINKVKKILNWD